ncbi:hypothetical protein J2S98_002613 [Arthrobacter oryzae]|uniref:hypothetical protein n=1 Tax=Arthrobacter oryzae TaxID=409290 RepID=UPI00277D997D|nr:hypothetical protein [Arthrobacter oryzae]MDP9987446.1 hypothetical protein [Arthrobacter oryzae]
MRGNQEAPGPREMMLVVGRDLGAGNQRGIDFGKYYLRFDAKFWSGVALCAVVVWVAIASADEAGDGVIAGILIVAGGLIGVLFAPSPKPIDHSQTAHSSVQRLIDMNADLGRARSVISQSITEEIPGTTALRLLAAQDLIVSQDQHFARAVDDWNEIAPGVVERVVHKRNEGKRRFQQLLDEGEQVEQ